MRATWTDECLDDLNHRVDDLGRRMDSRFAAMDISVNHRFDRVEARIDAMQRTMIQVEGGMIAATQL